MNKENIIGGERTEYILGNERCKPYIEYRI